MSMYQCEDEIEAPGPVPKPPSDEVYVNLNVPGVSLMNWIGYHVDITGILTIDNGRTGNEATREAFGAKCEQEIVVCRLDDQETKFSPR